MKMLGYSVERCRVHGRILGAFVAVNAASGRRFEGHHVQLLESIAHHLALAIEATDLYRNQWEEARRRWHASDER